MHIDFTAVLLVLAVWTIVGARHGFGPIVWAKRASGRKRAESGEDRRALLARVRELLPQASEENTVFSLYVDSHTSGGSKVRVTTYTYYSRVFVLEGESLWLIPLSFDKRSRDYALSEPLEIPQSMVRDVQLSGKRGKKLTVSLALDLGGQTDVVQMVLQPFCFRKTRYYPFDLLQESACQRLLDAVEKMALAVCGKTPEDLEAERLKDECSNYGLYAAMVGFLGVMLSPAGMSHFPMYICFGISLALLLMILVKKRIPKLSAVVVAVEIAAAFFLMD